VTYCLDTSFLVDFLRGDPAAVERARALEERHERRYVPAPGAHELLEGALNRGQSHLARAIALLDAMDIIPTDMRVASDAARIGSEGRGRGYPITGIDALIAASARVNHLILLTRDQAFARVHGLAVEPY